MRILQPFIITILNRLHVHPLQAASNHSGEKLVNIGDSAEYLPSKRSAVVAHSELVLPPRDGELYEQLPECLKIRKSARADVIRNARNALWLRVDWREKRKAAQFCRQFELALPPDIALESARAAVVAFAERALVSSGMIVDLAIHESRALNPISNQEVVSSRVAYLMCTTRPFERGSLVNKNRDWNDRTLMLEWRRAWFDALAEALPADMADASQEAKDLEKFAKRFGTRLPVAKAADPVDDAPAPRRALPRL
jgi:hypothetical protein